jgi:DNA-binding IclR family transcriptional regulator
MFASGLSLEIDHPFEAHLLNVLQELGGARHPVRTSLLMDFSGFPVSECTVRRAMNRLKQMGLVERPPARPRWNTSKVGWRLSGLPLKPLHDLSLKPM